MIQPLRHLWSASLAIALSQYFSEQLQIPGGMQVVELTSTLQNRFDLLRDGTVQLECGPNRIRQGIAGVTFSNPIYVTGTRLFK